MLSLPPASPRTSHTPIHPTLCFCVPTLTLVGACSPVLPQTHRKTNKQKRSLVLYWPTIPGACHEVWLISPGTLHWRKLVFLLPAVSIASSFLVRHRISRPLPHLPWTYAGLVDTATVSVHFYMAQWVLYCMVSRQTPKHIWKVTKSIMMLNQIERICFTVIGT